jgi:hypothetical protein
MTLYRVLVLVPLLVACGDSSDGGNGQTTPCGELVCVANASCLENLCFCNSGYSGVGTEKCTKIGPPGECPTLPALTKPERPTPADKDDDRSTTAALTLYWTEPASGYDAYDKALAAAPATCKDRSREQTTTYAIYFGTQNPPPLLKQDIPADQSSYCKDDSKVCYTIRDEGGTLEQRTNFKVVTTLKPGTPYYWKIVVKSADGSSVEGPIWSFTTRPDARCPGTPTVTDKDGNSHDTVQIGSLCWMNDNLKVGKLDPGTQTDNGIIQKSCHSADSKDPACSGLYSWNEATNYDKPGSICPTGWRLPTLKDWQALLAHADFKRFSPAYNGYKNSQNIGYGGVAGYYWTAEHKNSGPDGSTDVIVLHWPTKNLDPELKSFNKGLFMSVRCVK